MDETFTTKYETISEKLKEQYGYKVGVVTTVNQNLINTIEETIQIQKEGRQQRVEAEKALGKIEDDLKNKLIEIMDK